MQKTCLYLGQTIILCTTAPGLTDLAAAIVHKDHAITFNQSSIRSLVIFTSDDPFEGKLHDCQLICIGQMLLPHGLLNIPRTPATESFQAASQHLGCSTELPISNGINV